MLRLDMAAYIRRLVDQDLAPARTQADLASITGIFNSGGSDIAKERSELIRTAIAERAARKKT